MPSRDEKRRLDYMEKKAEENRKKKLEKINKPRG